MTRFSESAVTIARNDSRDQAFLTSYSKWFPCISQWGMRSVGITYLVRPCLFWRDGITSHRVIHQNDRMINMIDITLFPHIPGKPKFSIFRDGKGWQTFVHWYLSEDMEKWYFWHRSMTPKPNFENMSLISISAPKCLSRSRDSCSLPLRFLAKFDLRGRPLQKVFKNNCFKHNMPSYYIIHFLSFWNLGEVILLSRRVPLPRPLCHPRSLHRGSK